jgi:hypothetical protein
MSRQAAFWITLSENVQRGVLQSMIALDSGKKRLPAFLLCLYYLTLCHVVLPWKNYLPWYYNRQVWVRLWKNAVSSGNERFFTFAS